MNAAPAHIGFGEALKFWLKLGFISFGGPAGQIAIMHRELVEQKRWISERRFLHALNYCMLLPGPEAQQLATYIGWLMHRTWGGLAAGVLFVLPSLLLLIGLSWVYVEYGQVNWVAGLLYGIKPAVAALVVAAVVRLGGKTLKTPATAPALWGLAALSFFAVGALKVPFPWVVLAAAIFGGIASRRWPRQFSAVTGPAHHGGIPGAAGAQAKQDHAPAVIDDDTPSPEHAQLRWARFAGVALFGFLLWLLPMLWLAALTGPAAALVEMAWFFTKAALLTFGGAYAVLPYVYQGAVAQHEWVTAAQMMDGLALGETTPGPLIIVVAFVGYLGGFKAQVLGPDALFLGAALAAMVATWFTFLPSFVFILAGGPVVEATHGKLKFTAPLLGVSAAVVGVIASLALLFIAGCLGFIGPHGTFRPYFDVCGAILLLLALVLLLRQKRGVVEVIALCAFCGMLLRLAGWR